MKKLPMLLPLLLVLPFGACATTIGGGGGAANARAVVDRQLQVVDERLRGDGYTAITNPMNGALNNGTSEDASLSIQNAGREHVMVGVCDGDCADMDLRLYDPSGREIAQDVADDDVPVVRFTPAAAGAYRVRVQMARCSSNPCYYAVGLYGR